MSFKLGSMKKSVKGLGRASLFNYVANNKLTKTEELDILYTKTNTLFLNGTVADLVIKYIGIVDNYFISRTIQPLLSMLDNIENITEEDIPRYREYYSTIINTCGDYTPLTSFSYDYDIKNKEHIENITGFELLSILLEVYGIEYALRMLYSINELDGETEW